MVKILPKIENVPLPPTFHLRLSLICFPCSYSYKDYKLLINYNRRIKLEEQKTTAFPYKEKWS